MIRLKKLVIANNAYLREQREKQERQDRLIRDFAFSIKEFGFKKIEIVICRLFRMAILHKGLSEKVTLNNMLEYASEQKEPMKLFDIKNSMFKKNIVVDIGVEVINKLQRKYAKEGLTDSVLASRVIETICNIH